LIYLSVISFLTICVLPLRGSDLLKPGNLVLSTFSADVQTIWAVDAISGDKQQLAQLNIGYYNDGMAITKDGRLFIAQDQQFRVLEINMQNGSYKVVAGNGLISNDPNALRSLNNLRDMEAADDNSLWIKDNLYIYHLDPNTSRQLVKIRDDENTSLQLLNSRGLGIEPDGSILKTYMGYVGNDDGAVTKMNPTTGEETLIVMLNNTHDVVSDGNGHIFALDYTQLNDGRESPDNLVKIDESTGASSVLASGLPALPTFSELVFSPGNGLYVSSPSPTNRGVWHIDPTTGASNVLTTFDNQLIGIAVIPVPEPTILTLAAGCCVCLLVYKSWGKWVQNISSQCRKMIVKAIAQLRFL
jgi:hypothetical protein